MSKLKTALSNEQGSVLVSALAFAIIMGMAGSGLMMLSGHSANMEDAAYKNDLAFQAFESGLQIGKRWLADPVNAGKNLTYNTTINGMDVAVTSNFASGVTTLTSSVSSAELDFVKSSTCEVDRDTSAWQGIFINTFDPAYPTLADIVFDGAFHSNGALLLGNNVQFRNGPVTVHDTTVHNSYGTDSSGNNYDYGIQGAPPLDTYFKNTFSHSQDSLYYPGLTRAPDTILSINSSPRATLFFYVNGSGVGMARYYYNGNSTSRPYREIQINNKIIQCNYNINVLGTVKGRVTIVTTANQDIYPVGDIIYDGTDLDDYVYGVTLPEHFENLGTNQNYLALVSGGNIHFKNIILNYIEYPYTSGILIPGNDPGLLFCTAALIATNPGKGITWDNDFMTNPHYFLYAIGCRAVDQFYNYTARFGAAANTRFNFYYDTRLRTSTLTAPGISGFKRHTAAGNELFLLKTAWREQHAPVH